MKTFVWIATLLLIVMLPELQLIAQESNTGDQEKKKLSKAEKKEMKEEQEKVDWEQAKKLVESKRFVFQSTDLFTSNGTVPLDAKTNFFYVIDDDAVLQFSFAGLQSVPTSNGLGGITSEAMVTKYEVSANNYKKPIKVAITVKPKAGQGTGIHQLSLVVYGGGYAELLLINNGARIKGSIISPEDSRIFEGSTR